MKIGYRAIIIAFLLALLVLIRYYESRLFYDPLLEFFSSNYLQDRVPSFKTTELLLHVFYRFFLNSLISLAIIYVAFLDKGILRFSVYLYLILFLITYPLFMFLIFTIENQNFLALFYVRRFLIQPIFVIILLPAFYYYRLVIRQGNEVEGNSLKN